ncbi:CapA family protein [Sandaracinus amylolyticus]|uniref:CapA family protein n=1 Tax=Sandaracinus amylolyticus TaxID=927083 RepID=UPI0014703CA0|nr:CapA family protein [Sandaracinus amylolyticus]
MRALACRAVVLAALVLALAPVRAQDADGPELALGGDVIFDGHITYAIERFFGDAPGPALRELLAETTPALSRADLAIVNLETPVGPRTHERGPEHDAPTFAAPPELLDALAQAGVDALTVANNHAYDQGVAGLASTLEHTARARLPAIGAGRDLDDAARAIVLDARGHRIAIAAFSEGTNRRVRDGDPDAPRIAIASDERIDASVRAARRDADFVVVSLHWTSPLDDRPTRTMQRFARVAADAGADLVYAHGPHQPAPAGRITTSDGRVVPVLWSLGNLVAVMDVDDDRVHAPEPSVRDAIVARVRTRRSDHGRLEVASIASDAYWIATPQRAWWSDPTSAMVRPLSLRAELARIARAACGPRCDRYAASYRARERMLASLLGAETPVESASPELASTTPIARPRSAPRIEHEPPTIPPELARGVALRIEFPHDGAVESSVDRAQIRAIADLLLADRSLRVEIVARPARTERAGIALQRAHRARGLVAILGPSRARFTLRDAPPAATASITLRVSR